MIKKPILITGLHRSGTTWVGKMIANSPSVGYVSEPFNINHHLGICSAKFDYWFPYISDENEDIYYNYIKRTVSFSYNLIEEIKTIRNIRGIKYLVKDYLNFLYYHFSNARPLIKDPIALFSAEWLASKFDMDVIVLIRHPAAFVGSLKRVNWTHPFFHFLEQPLLMKDHLFPFEAEVREYANRGHDLIDKAILLWKLIHHIIIEYKNNHKDWIFIRHEDISRNPLDNFRTLFEKLDLKFTDYIKAKIKEYSKSSNPSESPKNGDSIKLDSKSGIWNWKRRLTKSEIERIRIGVEDVSSVFYSDEDW